MKITNQEILEWVKNHPSYTKADIAEFANNIGMSYGNMVWRIDKVVDTEVDSIAMTSAPAEDLNVKVVEPVVEKIFEIPEQLKLFVPTEDGLDYVHREVDDDINFWSSAVDSSVALIGASGSGKTRAVIEYARIKKLPLLIVPCEDSQVLKELMGQPTVVDGTISWKEGLLSIFVKSPSVVLFDEVNSLPSSKLFFLHELLNDIASSRKIFVKDAPPEFSIVKLHADCKIFLAMNPPSAAYSGTNRLNCALSNRPAWIEVQSFRPDELGISSGDVSLDSKLMRFYFETQLMIEQQKLRIVISRRNISRIASAIKKGASLRKAIMQGFINSALATASTIERDVLLEKAILIFGTIMKYDSDPYKTHDDDL